ncbi:hypothetical protein OK351_17675 [Glutamicibacter sp. MNS18]|uniref:hypothetical protein n=1 Tax=Glutamicibacter sp. MNS18 TaxID=2989817 RepID=UPI0022361082|nr:hypothetical protein [Glutamicibacter sp. MNS18]MCW4467311.1 hypothetical protein [Glutamicibacter sp. MNS18]
MPYVEAILPTIVVALIFWYVIKAVMNADRSERQAEAEADRSFGFESTSGDSKSQDNKAQPDN